MKKSAVVLLLFLNLHSVCAQVAAEHAYALPFTRLAKDPVAASLAGAAAAYPDAPAFAAFNNPASILSGMSLVSAGVNYGDFLSAGASVKAGDRFGLSLGFFRDKGEDYEIFDSNGNAKGTFTPSDMSLKAGVCYKFSDNIVAGGVVSYASSDLAADYKIGGLSFDLLAQYSTGAFLLVAGVKNLGPAIKSDSGTGFSQASSASIAGSWKIESDKIAVCALAELDAFLAGSFGASAGAELNFAKIVSIRGGCHFSTEGAPIPSYAAVGAGVNVWNIGFNLSCLFAPSTIGGSFLAGISYSF